MAVWVVRAGRWGEYEERFMTEGLVGIDFGVRKSAADFSSRESLREHAPTRNAADQLWNFMKEIRVGDMVVLPRKSPRVISIGKVTGAYQYRDDLEAPHVRPVVWDAQDISRSSFDQDLLNSMGGLATVFQVRAEDAETRIAGILAKHLGRGSTVAPQPAPPVQDDAEFKVDIEEQIKERIIEHIQQRISGAGFEYLVAEILQASGYYTLKTRRGADGGVDVLAGQGDMGLGQPQLCVQVKSGHHVVDLSEYNRLQGNIGSFGASHGLLVSLGGFTRQVLNENERSFFQIRLWGPDELLEQLLETYDRLPEDIRSEIPLRNRRVLIETE